MVSVVGRETWVTQDRLSAPGNLPATPSLSQLDAGKTRHAWIL